MSKRPGHHRWNISCALQPTYQITCISCQHQSCDHDYLAGVALEPDGLSRKNARDIRYEVPELLRYEVPELITT
eukprot:6209239-Pleurochrysis_carterae.AAC.1